MAELVYAHALGACPVRVGGSSPLLPTLFKEKENMTNLKSFFLIIFCVLLFNGCTVVYGPKINSSTLYQIKEGETTKQDVINLLGKPMDIARTENNEETYLYERQLSKYSYTTTEVSRLTIVFNKAGIVKKRNLDELMFPGPYYSNPAAARDAATQTAVAGSVHQMQQQNSYHY